MPLRRGEVLGLTWDDVDFQNSLININQQLISSDDGFFFDTPKSESSIRKIFAPPLVFNFLQSHKEKQDKLKASPEISYMDSNLVCCNTNGTPINPKSFSKRFASFLRKNNLKHIRFHDLRHSYASLALALGTNLKVTSETMGHSNINITADTYSHVADDLKRDVARKIDTLLINIYTKNTMEA